MQHRNVLCIAAAGLLVSSLASAATFTFNTDPFAGTNVLTTPGRQIVGGEDFISFDIATDVFALDAAVFQTGNTIEFANAPVNAIPAVPLNVVVLDSFDDDNNPATPFGAGQAANLIAGRMTVAGPGFFIYFNQALDLPRLVYSTDLSSTTSDLKILARMLNLNGAAGRNAMPTFTEAKFAFTDTPEPGGLVMITGGILLIGCSCHALSRRGQL